LQAEKQSGREKQVVINQGVWFSVLASGPSAHPKNARDLTVISFATNFMIHMVINPPYALSEKELSPSHR
jgi:hypothetical protein